MTHNYTYNIVTQLHLQHSDTQLHIQHSDTQLHIQHSDTQLHKPPKLITTQLSSTNTIIYHHKLLFDGSQSKET